MVTSSVWIGLGWTGSSKLITLIMIMSALGAGVGKETIPLK
jgi:hypothetical protein